METIEHMIVRKIFEELQGRSLLFSMARCDELTQVEIWHECQRIVVEVLAEQSKEPEDP